MNGGTLLRRIAEQNPAAGNSLRIRLAIDQLRVALSRPTGQLIWIDVAPDAQTIRQAGDFLRDRGTSGLPPMNFEALRASLAEEELSVEERIQRCEKDARQFVDVKPDLAWSRAHQAVAMLGSVGDPMAAGDPALREQTWLTLAEICFKLAIRGKKLSAELGRQDLYSQSADAARRAQKFNLANAIRNIGALGRGAGEGHLNDIASMIQTVSESRKELPSWLILEITPRADGWLAELEAHIGVGDNATIANRILPPFFDTLGMPDAQERKERLAQRSVRLLMKNRKHLQALTVLAGLPDTEANRHLVAECREESGQFAEAAAKYVELGEKDKALRCYRAAADFGSALNLVRQLESHPARESLEWLEQLGGVLDRRPENFNRVMTAPEKKLLETMLEKGLGVQRKKPAAKKAAGPKKAAVKKAAVKKAPAPKSRPVRIPKGRRDWGDVPF